MCQGCAMGLVRIFLFVVNIVFFAAGGAILGVGIWIRVDPRTATFARILAPTAGAADPMLQNIAWVLIALGALIFLVGFLGCCGALCENTCMLASYGGIVILLAILQIVAGILAAVFIGRINTGLQGVMNDGMNNYNNSETLITAWDSMQVWMTCCGSDSYTNWNTTTRSRVDQRTRFPPQEQVQWKAFYPPSCCVLTDRNPDKLTDKTNYKNFDRCRTHRGSTIDVVNTQGCYNTMISFFRRNTGIIIGIAFGFVAIQFLVAAMAGCLRKKINEEA